MGRDGHAQHAFFTWQKDAHGKRSRSGRGPKRLFGSQTRPFVCPSPTGSCLRKKGIGRALTSLYPFTSAPSPSSPSIPLSARTRVIRSFSRSHSRGHPCILPTQDHQTRWRRRAYRPLAQEKVGRQAHVRTTRRSGTVSRDRKENRGTGEEAEMR